MKVPLINLTQPQNCGSYVTRLCCFLIIDYQTYFMAMEKLMQYIIKMPPSFITFFSQFQMKASYFVTLLCFMYKTKLNKQCFEANLDGCQEMWFNSLMDLTCLMMVRTTSYTNSSNLLKMKLVKVLNKPNITRIVTKTSCTFTPTSMIVCLPPSILLASSNLKC